MLHAFWGDKDEKPFANNFLWTILKKPFGFRVPGN